jgi:alpha-tubulin suppressor-like RCC1 family protein
VVGLRRSLMALSCGCGTESAPTRGADLLASSVRPPLESVVEIAAGASAFCARNASEVLCWGNGFGPTAAPVALPGPAQAITVGRNRYVSFACAVVAAEVWCWGQAQHGVLGAAADGDPGLRAPQVVPGTAGAVAISAGMSHVCGLLGDGRVLCWGLGSDGQLGTPGPGGGLWSRATPEVVPGLPAVVQVRAGKGHTCAVDGAGGLWCWGSNEFGQVGGEVGTGPRPPARVSGLDAVVAVGTGEVHTCALSRDGRVSCFGERAEGQTGAGQAGLSWPSPQPEPLPVVGLPPADALEIGPRLSCARASGAWWCWGDGGPAAVVGGAASKLTVATPISTWGAAESLAVGEGTVCLWRDRARCVGENRAGQLGADIGGGDDATGRPRRIDGLPRAVSSAGGPGVHVAVSMDGRAWWWGSPSAGAWGQGQPVAFAEGVTSVSAAHDHLCALVSGELRCATGAQVADGGPLAPVPGMGGLTGISASAWEVCGWTASGALKCLDFSCLESGPAADRCAAAGTVREAVEIGPVAQASAGAWGACATDRAGLVWCRGDNDRSQLGDGGGPARSRFAPVEGLPPAVQVQLGADHACARTLAGEVWCWGASDSGQAGASGARAGVSGGPARSGGHPGRHRRQPPTAAPVTVTQPRAIDGLSEVTDLAVGADHGCAVTGGAVRCWGSNQRGQVGDGRFDEACPEITEVSGDWCKVDAFAAPVQVGGLSDVVGVAAGDRHTCANDRQGAIWCWGDASHLQLGPTFGPYASVPVFVRR